MGNLCHQSARNYADLVEVDNKKTVIDDVLHTGSVLGLHALGNNTVSCSDDRRICIFDWASPAQSKFYCSGHDKAVNRVLAVDAHVWSVSRDLSLRQWDPASGTVVQTIAQTHELNVSALAAHPTGKTIFTGSRDYHVKAWDASTGTCTSSYSCPRNIVTALEMGGTTDPALLYQASEDLCVRGWDTREASASMPALHLTGFVYFPLCLAVHPDGHTLSTGCKGFNSVGCEVKLWDLRSCTRPLVELLGHSQDVTGVRFSSDGAALVSASKDGSIYAWHTQTVSEKTHSPMHILPPDGRSFSSLSLAANGSKFAVGAHDGSISLLELGPENMHIARETAAGNTIDGVLEDALAKGRTVAQITAERESLRHP